MKKYQFEEITAALSIIIALLAYKFDVIWLYCIYVFKAVFDTLCALTYGYKSALKDAIKRKTTQQNGD